MEDNNNNIIIKGLAIILIAILGLNVYRTETTKNELAALSDTVSQIQSQIDSLDFPVGQPTASNSAGNRQMKGLEKRITSLESKVSTLQSSVEHLSKSSSQTTTRASSSLGTSAGNTSASNGGGSQNGRVSVSAKVKVENRYVKGTTFIPNVTSGPAGVVIIDVTMDRIGIVGAVSVNTGTTITDEEIIDQCKESALKTHFSFNPDAPDKSKGTIIYTFTAR